MIKQEINWKQYNTQLMEKLKIAEQFMWILVLTFIYASQSVDQSLTPVSSHIKDKKNSIHRSPA